MKIIRKIILALIILIIVAFGAATWYFSGQIVAFAPRTNEEKNPENKFPKMAE